MFFFLHITGEFTPEMGKKPMDRAWWISKVTCRAKDDVFAAENTPIL